jgi:hypothetical protein
VHSGLTIDQAGIDVSAAWADVHAELRTMVLEEVRKRDYSTGIYDRLIAQEAHFYRLRPVFENNYTKIIQGIARFSPNDNTFITTMLLCGEKYYEN